MSTPYTPQALAEIGFRGLKTPDTVQVNQHWGSLTVVIHNLQRL